MESTVETTVELGTLTKTDVAALKQADHVCFDRERNGDSGLRCIKELKKAGPYEDRERTYEIACTSVLRGGEGTVSQAAQCFELEYVWRSGESVIGSIISLLRVGDVIQLEWLADNSNGYLREALTNGRKLYRDELYLRIKRNGKYLRFHVATSICPDNTARMIRA